MAVRIDDDVRALTLLNPWAHAIAHEGKTVENRSWMPPEGIDRFLIHAGKGWDEFAELPGADRWPVQAGAIVAVVDLLFACGDSPLCGCDPQWAMGDQKHWNLKLVHTLKTPVPCRGALGLWRPTRDLIEAVRTDVD